MARRANGGDELHPRCAIFGALMREEREREGRGQKVYGKAAGVSRQKIGAIERGEAAADADLLFKLEDAGFLRPSELMRRAFRREAGLVEDDESDGNPGEGK